MRQRPLVRIEGLDQALPVKGGVLQRTVARCRRWTASTSRSAAARRSAWWASRAAARPPSAACSCASSSPTPGTILFDGTDITRAQAARTCKPYRRQMQIIFQDPFASLDPRTPIGDSIGEGLRIHGIGTPAERRQKVARDDGPGRPGSPTTPPLPARVLAAASASASASPARWSWSPDLIVCDEPVSALDVSIQAQILNLLKQLQRELGLTYLFIAHNLGVVEHISDRVAVMYLGRVVELADREELFRDPRHPYTLALLSAIPVPDPTLQAQAHHPDRRRAQPGEPAGRLPLPPALLAARPLASRRSAPRASRRSSTLPAMARTAGGLPLPRASAARAAAGRRVRGRRQLAPSRRARPRAGRCTSAMLAGAPTTVSGAEPRCAGVSARRSDRRPRAAGASCAQRRLAVSQSSGLPSCSRSQQRVWKRQPDGGLPGDGTSPLRTRRRLRRRGIGLRHGRQERHRVRVARVARRGRRRGASSTILPRYMTPTRSLMYWTTDRLWAMNR